MHRLIIHIFLNANDFRPGKICRVGVSLLNGKLRSSIWLQHTTVSLYFSSLFIAFFIYLSHSVNGCGCHLPINWSLWVMDSLRALFHLRSVINTPVISASCWKQTFLNACKCGGTKVAFCKDFLSLKKEHKYIFTIHESKVRVSQGDEFQNNYCFLLLSFLCPSISNQSLTE